MTGASFALGYKKQWATELLSTPSNRIRSLSEGGFQGKIEIYRTITTTGEKEIKTISLQDFSILIMYAASKGKERAIALNAALVKMSLEDFFRNAFQDRLLTFVEKQAAIDKAYNNYLQRKFWRD